jgi:C-terminal processing protease CtpA/Prc
VNWEKLISWVTPALAAPGDLDPLPYMFSLMAKELPSGGHTYVYNTASSASPTEENSVEFPKCTNRRNHEVLLTLPETPSNKRDENDYIRAAHRCFRQPNVNHWIIDLRQNSGGDAALQVAALTPLIGLGTSLQYLNNKGNYIAVRITPKGVFNSHLLQYAFHRKPIFIPQSAKVTVLLGSGCASACEALAIALTAKQNIQSMGQATAGFATGNEILKINDNFNLALTSGYMTDRDGKVIYPRITPDILASDEIINKIFKID